MRRPKWLDWDFALWVLQTAAIVLLAMAIARDALDGLVFGLLLSAIRAFDKSEMYRGQAQLWGALARTQESIGALYKALVRCPKCGGEIYIRAGQGECVACGEILEPSE